MKTRKRVIKLIIIVLVLLIAYLIYLFIVGKNEPPCARLGCPENTMYVGSANSDKYYTCECGYAKSIKKENMVCFLSDADALTKNYTKVNC